MPLSVEESLLFWLNKCGAKFGERLQLTPLSDNSLTCLRDVGEGRYIAFAISFYRPNDLSAEGKLSLSLLSACTIVIMVRPWHNNIL